MPSYSELFSTAITVQYIFYGLLNGLPDFNTESAMFSLLLLASCLVTLVAGFGLVLDNFISPEKQVRTYVKTLLIALLSFPSIFILIDIFDSYSLMELLRL